MLWSPPTTAGTLQVLQRTKVNALVSTYHCMHIPGTLEDQDKALVSTYHCMHTLGTPEDKGECSSLHFAQRDHSRYSTIKENAVVPTYHCIWTKVNALVPIYYCKCSLGTPILPSRQNLA